jgi:hypothetical protein
MKSQNHFIFAFFVALLLVLSQASMAAPHEAVSAPASIIEEATIATNAAAMHLVKRSKLRQMALNKAFKIIFGKSLKGMSKKEVKKLFAKKAWKILKARRARRKARRKARKAGK